MEEKLSVSHVSLKSNRQTLSRLVGNTSTDRIEYGNQQNVLRIGYAGACTKVRGLVIILKLISG